MRRESEIMWYVYVISSFLWNGSKQKSTTEKITARGASFTVCSFPQPNIENVATVELSHYVQFLCNTTRKDLLPINSTANVVKSNNQRNINCASNMKNFTEAFWKTGQVRSECSNIEML